MKNNRSAGGALTWSQNGTWIRPYVTWFLPVSICQNTSSLRDRLLSTIRKSHPLRGSYFLTLGTCTVQLCCQFIWSGKALKNSPLTLLYNKLIGPDLSLLVISDYPNLPPFLAVQVNLHLDVVEH